MKIEECGEKLVDLAGCDFVLEPKYFQWKFSYTDVMELRSGVVERLKGARERLRARTNDPGLNFIIWDGYRPVKVQRKLYQDYWKELQEQHPDWDDYRLKVAVEKFVAFPSEDPEAPAPHNTGGAVDLTLVDGKGFEYGMGTVFDEFTEKAVTDYFSGESKSPVHFSRMLMKGALEEEGFVNYEGEWWHFEYGTLRWARMRDEEAAVYGSVELDK